VISDTKLHDIGADFGHEPGDLVAQHGRHRNDIVRGEQQVGATQSGRLYLYENFAPNRRRDVHILEVESTTQCVDYKRFHAACLPLPPNRPAPRKVTERTVG
jgi:hypothetical protein